MDKLRYSFISRLRNIHRGYYLLVSECEVSAEPKNAEAEHLHEYDFLEIQMGSAVGTMQTSLYVLWFYVNRFPES
jgi:hypothetical protein